VRGWGGEKLGLIEQYGATPLAFTFKQRFTANEMIAVQPGNLAHTSVG
jgi:hypothetical protein